MLCAPWDRCTWPGRSGRLIFKVKRLQTGGRLDSRPPHLEEFSCAFYNRNGLGVAPCAPVYAGFPGTESGTGPTKIFEWGSSSAFFAGRENGPPSGALPAKLGSQGEILPGCFPIRASFFRENQRKRRHGGLTSPAYTYMIMKNSMLRQDRAAAWGGA